MTLTSVDRVATLTLSRPPVNAISEDWLDALGPHLDALERDTHLLAVRICSNQKAFCAGADLRQIGTWLPAPDASERIASFVSRMQIEFARIEALPQVTLAEIGGAAMGGGLELALACDLRFVAAEARLGLPEARLGVLPAAGGTQRMTRVCGHAVASRLILGAEILDGSTAAALGLATWVAPRAELTSVVDGWLAQATTLSRAALAACKSCIAATGNPERNGYQEELDYTRRLYQSPDTRARVAAFLAGSAR